MKKIVFISSGGGHYSELKCLEHAFTNTYKTYWVVENDNLVERHKDMHLLFNTNVKQRSIKYLFRFGLNAIKSVYLFLMIRPQIIMTTGANTAIVMMILGKFFKRKTIFIETSARVNQPSKAGKVLHKLSSLTIVQWESMKDIYPGSVYGGLIF